MWIAVQPESNLGINFKRVLNVQAARNPSSLRGLGHPHMPIYNLSVFTQTETTTHTHTWIQHSAPSVPRHMNSSFCESMKQQLVKRGGNHEANDVQDIAFFWLWVLGFQTQRPSGVPDRTLHVELQKVCFQCNVASHRPN